MKGKYKKNYLISDFKQYKKQPIMLEKWLQVQASAKTKK